MLLPTHLTYKGNDFFFLPDSLWEGSSPGWTKLGSFVPLPLEAGTKRESYFSQPYCIFAYCCNKRVGTFYVKMELTIFPGPVRKQAELPSEGIEPRTIPCSCFLTQTKIELWTIPGQYLPKAWFVLIHLSVFQHNSLIFISFCSKNREHRSGQLHRL